MNANAPLNTTDGGMLTVAEAAGILGVSVSTVWRWIGQSRVPAYRLGPKRVRLKRSELECLLVPVRGEDEEAEPPIRRLTPEEQRRAFEAIERAREFRARLFAERGGVLFQNGWELLNEARDERFEQL